MDVRDDEDIDSDENADRKPLDFWVDEAANDEDEELCGKTGPDADGAPNSDGLLVYLLVEDEFSAGERPPLVDQLFLLGLLVLESIFNVGRDDDDCDANVEPDAASNDDGLLVYLLVDDEFSAGERPPLPMDQPMLGLLPPLEFASIFNVGRDGDGADVEADEADG